MPTRRGNITKAPTAQDPKMRVNVNLHQAEYYEFRRLCDGQDRDVSDVIRAFIQRCIKEGKLNA